MNHGSETIRSVYRALGLRWSNPLQVPGPKPIGGMQAAASTITDVAR